MALEFEAEPTFTPGALTQVFERGGGVDTGNRRMAVSPDGQRFLFLTAAAVNTGSEATSSSQINVVLNWTQELLERVPVP